ncbi:Metalloenzyme, LuxS/M16 peptidase-like protein [Mycena belliarum]|uniref:Alpha-MPP n=1 Tax=Mycena belliarum TaxID=1033014 RepID=A0AAD6UH92_9AGAR|nr:Metalloenzyme, LuxS/M16 peptidase-like protein [Mycena belliae]
MRRAGSSIARRGNVLCSASRRALTHDASPSPDYQLTTLPNKIRVATQLTPGHFSSVGLYVDAGSRYETPASSGVSHFLDRMAFKSTASRTSDEMAAAVHGLGGQIMASSSRESIMYQSSHFHRGTPQALSLIADTVLNPSFLPEEIVAQRDAARYELREISSKPEQILPEILHEVAYGGKGLGNPLLCPAERIDVMNGHTLLTSMKEWYRPERMVIAGAGMPHEQLVELTDRYFSSLKSPELAAAQPTLARPIVPPPLSSTSPPSVVKSMSRAASYLFPTSPATASDDPSLIDAALRSSYTGGHRYIHDPDAEFNHLYVAFEGAGIHDDDIYALATMQVLLGGGGSFSAGGPGKGMYSRLYTHILNYYSQVDHCASFHHIYTDSSLFGLFASFLPAGQSGGNTPAQILPHLVHQLSLLLHTPIPAAELDRAKNQLKSSLMMALESRSVEVEDLGRQLLVHKRKISTLEMTDKIDMLKPADIRAVAEKVFGPESGGNPTVVCMGREDTGPWKEVFEKYSVAA